MNVRRLVLTFLFVAASAAGAAAQDEGFMVSDKIPHQKESVSNAAAMMFDFLPGGGHFYTGHYYAGAAFGLMKAGGAGAAWYSYTVWKKAERRSRDAERERIVRGLSGSDSLDGFGGRTRSADDYKKDSDRRAQYFTFSLIGNLALYTASWITVWRWCDLANDAALPSFDVVFNGGTSSFKADMSVQLCAVKKF